MTNTSGAFGIPYSTIRKIGDFYYISGHTGLDLAKKTAAPDVKGQTTKLFENLAETMKAYNLNFDDIVKTTVFLTDMGDFVGMNEVYTTYFNDPKPARSTVAVKELPRVADIPLKVEIEAIAYKKS
ncbi:MAG: RidA family protein [Candidatus Levyibacteriota bacterium]